MNGAKEEEEEQRVGSSAGRPCLDAITLLYMPCRPYVTIQQKHDAC